MSHDCKLAIVRLVLIFKKITVDFIDFIQSKNNLKPRCIGVLWPGFGSGGAAEVASVRS